MGLITVTMGEDDYDTWEERAEPKIKAALLALADRYEQGHPKMGDPKAN